MNDAPTYRTLLARAANALTAATDPDSGVAQQALLLAAHAGLHRRDGTDGADWDLYTAAITHAVRELQAEVDDPVVLGAGIPRPGPDSIALRHEVADLVRRLAGYYATAAAGNGWSPWRRLVWAQVAHLLDDAVAELT